MTRPSHRRIATLRALTGATVLAAGIGAAVPVAAQAAVPCNAAALVQAINDANAAGGGNVVLTPLCTYNLTASSATGQQGADGLPVITTAVTLTGNQDLIARSMTAPAFRIAEVASTGNLTLKLVTLDHGVAVGDGGGILNYGAVTLTGGALTNNQASGVGGGLANEDVAAPGTGTAATFVSSTVSGNISSRDGGGIYNGFRGTLSMTSSSVTSNMGSLLGGGIAAENSTATSLTTTPVSANAATLSAGGIYRVGGTMTIVSSPISANTSNNCVGSLPGVPSCIA